jgi:hemolysin III
MDHPNLDAAMHRMEDELRELRPVLRGISHAVTFWIALVAAVVLVLLVHGTSAKTAAIIYGIGLCGLFGVSGTYHRWRWNPRWRPILRRIDHSTIFVFIAASYTPIALLTLDGPLRWWILGVVWAGATAGVFMSIFWIDAPRWLVAAVYLALGWVAIAATPQLIDKLGVAPLTLLAIGGVLYSLGAVIYGLKRPDPWPKVFGFHEIFHLLVVAAATAHFVAMAGWVFPQAA